MRKLVLTPCAVAGFAFGLLGSAQAAPSTSPSLKGAASPAAEYIQFRRCWWDDGRRVCRYGFGYRNDDRRGYRFRDRDERWRWRGRRDRD